MFSYALQTQANIHNLFYRSYSNFSNQGIHYLTYIHIQDEKYLNCGSLHLLEIIFYTYQHAEAQLTCKQKFVPIKLIWHVTVAEKQIHANKSRKFTFRIGTFNLSDGKNSFPQM